MGFQPGGSAADLRPKPASQYLLEKMHAAGAREAFIILRSGKWDIAEYYGSGSRLGLDIAYLITAEPYGPPFTLDRAFPFITGATVVFGFPDILFQPDDAFVPTLQRLETTGADVVVGVFPAHPADLIDVIETQPDGRVVRLEVKEHNPSRTHGQRAWVFAVWTPTFTDFLHTEVSRLRDVAAGRSAGSPPEWPVGTVIDAAIEAGLHVDSVFFEGYRYLDIGTPEGLAQAWDFPGVWRGTGLAPSGG